MTIATLQDQQATLPTPQSTSSYWHRQPSEKLLGHRTTPELPSRAEVVVVGSGITGAFAARELVAGGRDVVMLEAREACWGATGRNGGHCQPLVFASKPHISRFELATYRYLKALVDAHGIPCDWVTVGGVISLDSPELVALVRTHLDRLRRDFPDLASEVQLVTDADELKRLRVRGAVAAVQQRNAAKLWPYRLVGWVLEALLDGSDGSDERTRFNLQTNTPVEHLQPLPDRSWVLHTPRGQMAARTVVLATNGYTSHLVPRLTGLLVPVRGQVAALTPPRDSTPLAHSHAWVAHDSDDYLIQPAATGELILGGERLSVPESASVGVSNDDEVDAVVAKRLRRAMREAIRLSPDGTADPDSLDATYEWTGIMGYSRDGHPFVGEVPAALGGGAGGLWISAGYTGHGMPVAARCGIAVAEEILGRKGVEVPTEWRVEGAREETARRAELPANLIGLVKMLVEEQRKG